ncbi:MAG: hypothetical protein V4608_00600 [Bacteroidota bacterium]
MKMKILLSVLFVLFQYSVVSAQQQKVLTTDEIRTAMTTVYSVFNQYVAASKLQKQGVNGISEEQELVFLELFEPNAMVWDDLTPFDFPDKTEKNSKKTVENLTTDYKKYFPGGLIVRILNSNINFENLSNRDVRIVIERNISGKYPGKYFITNEGAVLEIVIKLSDDFTSAKIAEILKIVG